MAHAASILRLKAKAILRLEVWGRAGAFDAAVEGEAIQIMAIRKPGLQLRAELGLCRPLRCRATYSFEEILRTDLRAWAASF